MQITFIFFDNIRILFLSFNVKKPKTTDTSYIVYIVTSDLQWVNIVWLINALKRVWCMNCRRLRSSLMIRYANTKDWWISLCMMTQHWYFVCIIHNSPLCFFFILFFYFVMSTKRWFKTEHNIWTEVQNIFLVSHELWDVFLD